MASIAGEDVHPDELESFLHQTLEEDFHVSAEDHSVEQVPIFFFWQEKLIP
jgi:hypothetical protein